jgi:hypothetical protein
MTGFSRLALAVRSRPLERPSQELGHRLLADGLARVSGTAVVSSGATIARFAGAALGLLATLA